MGVFNNTMEQTSLSHEYYTQAVTYLEECEDIIRDLLERIDDVKENEDKMFKLLCIVKAVAEQLRMARL